MVLASRVRSAARSASQDGLTVVELVVAAAMFAVVTTAFASALMSATSSSGADRARVTAANVADRQAEFLRSAGAVQSMQGRTSTVVTVAGVPYTVVSDVQWIRLGTTVGPCDGGSGTSDTLAYQRADVTVTWPNMGRVQPVTSSTLVLPRRETSTSPGTIGVKVRNSAGVAQPGHVVTLTLPDGTTQQRTTDSVGCAFFSHLQLVSYTASLNTPGYVDEANNPTPSQGVPLTETEPGPAIATFTYNKTTG